MNADGSNQHKIPNTRHSNYEIGRYGSYGGNPAFSRNLPGGNKIIFDKNKNIWTINPDGTGLTRITNAAAGGTCRRQTPTFVHPVWSPVSNKIAFSYLCGKDRRELHVMALSDLRGQAKSGRHKQAQSGGRRRLQARLVTGRDQDRLRMLRGSLRERDRPLSQPQHLHGRPQR